MFNPYCIEKSSILLIATNKIRFELLALSWLSAVISKSVPCLNSPIVTFT